MIPALAVAAGAVAQAVSGIGFSLVCAPVLIATLGPREGVRAALLLSSVLNVTLLATRRQNPLDRGAALLLVPALAVTPIVAAGAQRVDARYLTAAAGALTIVSAAALASGLRWQRAQSPLAAVMAGAVSGTMNVIGSIGGPALALYTVNAGWPRERSHPALQLIFLLSNVVALAALGLPSADRIPALTAGLGAGSIVGLVAARFVTPTVASRATLAVAAAGGIAALTRAFRPL